MIGGERLDKICVGTKRQPLLAVALTALGTDNKERSLAIVVVIPYETDQFKTIDIRHINIGYDQVNFFAGKNP